MLEMKINLWDIPDEDGVKAITTNGVVNEQGKLIMGAGIAKQAATRYPDLPLILGGYVMIHGNIPFYIAEYNIISYPTKNNWRNTSPLKLIEQSAHLLVKRIEEEELEHVFLPRPGCSLGGRDYETEVKPLLEPILPDTVTIVSL